jgi:hypothetical protein
VERINRAGHIQPNYETTAAGRPSEVDPLNVTDAVGTQLTTDPALARPSLTAAQPGHSRSIASPLGIALAGTGPLAIALGPVELSHDVKPGRITQSQATTMAVTSVLTHNPQTAAVKAALFQVLRQRQPDMSPDDVHAANQFIEAGRTPEEQGVRVMTLARAYQRSRPSAAQIDAMGDFALQATGTEGATVRLYHAPKLLGFTPQHFEAVSGYLGEGSNHDNRLDLLVHVSRHGITPAGIENFGAIVYGEHGDSSVRRDAAFQLASEGALG